MNRNAANRNIGILLCDFGEDLHRRTISMTANPENCRRAFPRAGRRLRDRNEQRQRRGRFALRDSVQTQKDDKVGRIGFKPFLRNLDTPFGIVSQNGAEGLLGQSDLRIARGPDGLETSLE